MNIPYGKQFISDQDIAEVVKVLKSDFLTQGPNVHSFEEAFANYIGSKYAVAVSNGTAALDLCVKAAGCQPGDKFITTPITFVASANCVKFNSGDVVFCDIDRETYLIDLNNIEDILKKSAKGAYKGIIPVDFAGLPVNLEEVKFLAGKYGVEAVIEDACHAPGAAFMDYQGGWQNCGNSVYADLAIFSFHPVKHIASGEGGMVTTNDERVYNKMLMLRSHGITKDPELLHDSQGGWYYEMQELSQNYRLTDFQAALGASQLKRADENMIRRRQIAKRYDDAFQQLEEIKCQKIPENARHAFHLYVIEVPDRKSFYDYLKQQGIHAQVHYIPAHLMPYYRQFGWEKGNMPNAEDYYDHCISLPMFPTLKEQEQDYVIEKVKAFFA